MKGEGEVDDVDVSTVGVRGQDAGDSSSSSFPHLKVLQLLGQQIHFWGTCGIWEGSVRQTQIWDPQADPTGPQLRSREADSGVEGFIQCP